MTANSNGTPRDQAPDADSDDWGWDDTDTHPAIDPREPTDPVDESSHREPPPVDIDEREDSAGDPGLPNVIELTEHVEPFPTYSPEDADELDEREARTDADPLTSDFDPFQPLDSQDDDTGSGTTTLGPDDDPAVTAEAPTASFNPISPPNVSDEGDTFVSEITHARDEGGDPDAVDRTGPGVGEAPGQANETPLGKASTLLSGAASRLGLGKLLDTSEEPAGATQGEPPPASRRARTASGIQGTMKRVSDSARAYVDPRLHMFSTLPHRRLIAISALVILICLLANSGGLALVVLSGIVPILILITITQHDVFERESNLLLAAVSAGGAIAGVVLSTIASWILGSQWFDEGVLNYGAAGFGGRFANAAGSAPWIVWLMAGLVVPAASIVALAGIPIALRRWPQFRNEVMDGMILTGASAAGFSIGVSVVYWWPMIGDSGPQTSVGDWTLSILGVAIVRPVIVTLCGAMIGAGIWRYMIATNASVIVLPAIGGVAGYLLLTFGSVQVQPSGAWPEFLWTMLIAAAVFALYRRELDKAVATDRRALGTNNERIVCPACHKVTPAGAFCAHCGNALAATSPGAHEPVKGEGPLG